MSRSDSMRAAVLRDNSGSLNVEDITIDKPERNEVLIQTVASGLCILLMGVGRTLLSIRCFSDMKHQGLSKLLVKM